MNLRINSLKLFVDLAESGSFSATAKHYGITQSAVSQQIGSLEGQFSVRLVERSRRRFRLTLEGEAVFQAAREILQSVERLKLRMVELDKTVSGELQVTTACSRGMEWLCQLIIELENRKSQIRLKVGFQPANLIYADVSGNVVDFAIVAGPRDDNRFEIVTIAEEPLCFVAAPAACPVGHLLDSAPFITYAPDPVTAQMTIQAAQAAGRPITPVLRFDHPDFVIKAVLATGGFSCLPLASVQEALADQKLVQVFSDHPAPVRKLAAVFHKGRMQQPLIKAMRDFIETFVRPVGVDGQEAAILSLAEVE